MKFLYHYFKYYPLFLSTVFFTTTNAQQLSPEQNKLLLYAKQGQIVLLPNFITQVFPILNYQKIILPGPQYIISDDPEYIRVPEIIAIREKVKPGTVRLYLYNVNGVKEPKQIETKITALLKNTGTADMHLRMLKFSSQKPSTNYFKMAKQGLYDYFSSQPAIKIITIKPGNSIPIDAALEKYIVKYNELVHGIYEFVIDQPGEVSVLQTNPSTPGIIANEKIKIIASSRHTNAGRGLFGVSNYKIITKDTFDTKNETVSLVLADGKLDAWVTGIDGSNLQPAELQGNYGIMYEVEMKWKSSNGKGLALVTYNARSGDSKWCGGMANTMIVSNGKFKEGIIQLPVDKLNTKGPPEVILIQIFTASKTGEVQTIRFTYSPPGASCLPTPLVFIPVEME